MVAFALLGLLTAAPAPGRVVAVHYFDNRTGNPEWDVLCKGVADMLVVDLAQVKGLSVVERDKLETVLGELKLQRTQWFEPKSAQQVGKLLGAQVIVTGQFIALEPAFIIEARALDVRSGKVVATARAKGLASDFFALETELAGALAAGLVPGAKVEAHGPADAASALEYSRALDEKDRGDVLGASRRISQLVRAAPDFRLGKQRAVELVTFLSHASGRHEEVMNDVRDALEARLKERAMGQGLDRICSQVLLSVFPAKDLRGIVGEGLSETGTNVLKKSAQAPARAAMERLVVITGALLEAVTASPLKKGFTACRGAERDESDFMSLGWKLPGAAPLTKTAVRDALIRLLVFGEVPAFTGSKFRVAPSLTMLSPALRGSVDGHLEWLKAALLEKGSPLAEPVAMGDWTELAGQVDVLFGRPDAAILKWQKFLTAYPSAPAFDSIKQRLERVLGTDADAVAFAEDLPKCSEVAARRMSKEVQRVGWAEGAKGLERLEKKVVTACKGNDVRVPLYTSLVSEAGYWGECALLRIFEKKLSELTPKEPHHVYADLCE